MACMKKPFRSEQQAVDNRDRMNRRKGKGPTFQVAYPCPDCTAAGFEAVWHLRTERPIEGKLIRLRGPKRRRPAHRPELDEDYEGIWAA